MKNKIDVRNHEGMYSQLIEWGVFWVGGEEDEGERRCMVVARGLPACMPACVRGMRGVKEIGAKGCERGYVRHTRAHMYPMIQLFWQLFHDRFQIDTFECQPNLFVVKFMKRIDVETNGTTKENRILSDTRAHTCTHMHEHSAGQ
jgi:hypothetical protein